MLPSHWQEQNKRIEQKFLKVEKKKKKATLKHTYYYIQKNLVNLICTPDEGEQNTREILNN